MYVAILGRQPAISVAELEQLYGSEPVNWFSNEAATVDTPNFDFERLGGSQKAGRVTLDFHGDWRRASSQIVEHYTDAWSDRSGKLTLGISAYGFGISPRDVQRTGLTLKSKLKNRGASLRLIPNAESALNTATSHHNKLGLSDNHVELLVVRATNGRVIVAESIGSQNITALAARDQARPRTDAFVGMLPPKLARIMVNLAGALPDDATLLDPFCGTGVVLQESILLGYNVYGSDLSEKMIDYSTDNLNWLIERSHMTPNITLEAGDAMKHTWHPTINAVVSEAYLGQPFSAPPRPEKLIEVRDNCNHIISTFLSNIHDQLANDTPLVIAVPAWRDAAGNFTHLPLIRDLERLGYTRIGLTHARNEQLLYYRENQVVAREILILKKK